MSLQDAVNKVSYYLEGIELCIALTTVVENLLAVSHFKHETFTASQYSQGVIKESNKMGSQVYFSWKILLSCPSHRHRVCKCELYATSTLKRDQPWDWKCHERICGKVLYVEDSSGGNYQGQGRGFTTGRQQKKIFDFTLCAFLAKNRVGR